MVDEPKAQVPATLQNFQGLLTQHRAAIAAVAPQGIDAERLLRLAYLAATKTPALLQCTIPSVLRVIKDASSLGLDIGGPMPGAFAIPFKNSKTGQLEATLVIGYQGLVDLARRAGDVANVEARVVHDGDVFECEYGAEPRLVHKPNFDTAGPLKYVYAVWTLTNGQKVWDVMTKLEIDAIRGRSKTGQFGPWATDYEAMAMKSVIRKSSKLMPKSGDFRKAVEIDTETETGELPVLDIEGEVMPAPTRKDELRNKLNKPKAETPQAQPAPTVEPEKAAGGATVECPLCNRQVPEVIDGKCLDCAVGK